MPTATKKAASATTETWESNVEGRVSMTIVNEATGRETHLTTRGKGQRLRISTEHRELVEEGIRDIQNNPFVNGKLSQISGPTRKPSQEEQEQELGNQQFTDDDLAGLFTLPIEDFDAVLPDLSQANVFRLRDLLSDRQGTVQQQANLTEYIEKTYPVTSGDTPSYREMRQEPIH